MTRIQASNQGPMGPLILSIDGHMKKTSGSLVDLKGAVCTRIRSGKSLVLPTWVLLFNGFGLNIFYCQINTATGLGHKFSQH